MELSIRDTEFLNSFDSIGSFELDEHKKNKLDLFVLKVNANEFSINMLIQNLIDQNLFFLHGAFHIYKDRKSFKKITQKSDKALYEKLEEVLNNEEQEVVCVFQHENKTDAINGNEYLRHCFDKLAQISGNLVIIGSSLADNDNHIFEKINNSQVDTLYISAFGNKEKIMSLAKVKLPHKKIYLFDAETISYAKSFELESKE